MSGTKHALVVEQNDGGSAVVTLDAELVTLGRTEENRLVLEDALASRAHAEIAVKDGRYVVYDLRSKNGTLVNGSRVEEHELANGDIILIGTTRLRFVSAQDEEALDALGQMYEQSGSIDGDMTECGGGVDISSVRLTRLADLANVLATSEDDLGVLEDVAECFLAVHRCERATIMLVEEGSMNPLMQATRTSATATDVQEETPTHVMRAGIEAKAPFCICGGKDSMGSSSHQLLVPLRVQERKFGFVLLQRDSDDLAYHETEVQLAAIAAAHVTTHLRLSL